MNFQVIELVIALSLAVIAGAALYVSISESRSNREHRARSVMPLLNIDRHQTGSTVGATLVNCGLGPAIITKSQGFRLDESGKLTTDYLAKAIELGGEIKGTLEIRKGGRRLLRQGEKVSLLSIKFPISVSPEEAANILLNIRFHTEAHDIYGQKVDDGPDRIRS